MSAAERWASRVLLAGGVIGVVLMVAGVLGVTILSGRGFPAPGRRGAAETIVSLHQIAVALSRRPIDPLGLAALGIVALVVTPLAAVASAGIAFAVEGERRFAVIAAIVVAALVVSFWLGGG